MSVKIRLQRHGKKGKPFYWIVAADARSKRDGKLLEKLGTYNPNTNPATINLDLDGAVKWLQNGAQPTDTARAILSYKGALLKNHLAGGVTKGALTEEQAEEKFNAWLEEKAGKITAKADGLARAKSDANAKALEAEKEANEERKAKALAPVEEEAVAEEAAEEVVAEETAAPVEEEAVTKETVAEEVAPVEEEIVADEVAEEAETQETPVAEETPAPVEEEAVTKETVAEEVAPVEEEIATEKVEAQDQEATSDVEVSNEEE